MSQVHDDRSPLIRFCDAFFQEQNIKWLLGIGMLILLGSSTMLVTSHWDSYTPMWKYVVLIAYTAAVHGAGQVAYHRLALRKTGTGLMALTVLLIPLSFFALRWVHPDLPASLDPEGETKTSAIFSVLAQSGLLVLIGINGVFSFLASRRIFRHFLRETQPTLLTAYLILSISGSLVPSLPAVFAPGTALLLWGVFAAGVIKANRHVFWLTEQHRLPRIFGFFPILLLGGQFLLLFATGPAAHLAWPWIGFGVVLTAIPILLAADALAWVIQQRSEETRPFPLSVALPLFGGLCVMIAGVCLSGTGFPHSVSVVPSAALAAVMLGVTARRTRNAGFVWGMLLLITMAYQTSPVFFKEFARTLVQTGAAAVQEQRLPLAFYGLTYLPLLVVLSGTSAWLLRRRTTGDPSHASSTDAHALFAVPMRRFAIGLPVLLLCIAFTHPKAILPVGLALTMLFGLQIILIRNRLLLIAALAAFVTAILGVAPFAANVLNLPISLDRVLLCWLTGSTLLWMPGRWVDRATQHFSERKTWWQMAPFCQGTSLGILTLTSSVWLLGVINGAVAPLSGLIVLFLWMVHAFRWRQLWISSLASAFPIVATLSFSCQAGWSSTAQLTLTAGLIAGMSLLSRWLQSWRESCRADVPDSTPGRLKDTIADVFASSSGLVAALGLILLQTLLLPSLLLASVGLSPFTAWLAAGLTLAATLELAWRRQSIGLTVLAWLNTLGLLGAAAIALMGTPATVSWIPALWAGFGTLCLAAVSRQHSLTMRADFPRSVVWGTLTWCSEFLLVAILVLSLPVLDGPIRIAACIALTGAFWMAYHRHSAPLTNATLLLANGHLLVMVVKLCVPAVNHVGELTNWSYAGAALPVAFVAALSALFWEWKRISTRRTQAAGTIASTTDLSCRGSGSFAETTSNAMQCIALGSLLWLIPAGKPRLELLDIILAMASFAILAGGQIWSAVRKSRGMVNTPAEELDSENWNAAEIHLWLGEFLLLLGLGYFALFNVLSLGAGGSMFGMLLAAALAWGFGQAAASSRFYRPLWRPLRTTALVLPAFAVLIGLGRHMSGIETQWLGMNSLALLLAAGFYFWQGLEQRRHGFLLGSATILNAALMMLWRELHWSDPQLFLVPVGLTTLLFVELLRNRLPEQLHNPLRYAGALIILVSPTFHIVGGSWLHLVTLMAASVAIVLLAMGLRVRALMYTGTAFLIADLLAMVVRGSLDHPSLLWIVGIGMGTAVIALAAYCERHREQMLQHLRLVAAQLETWK